MVRAIAFALLLLAALASPMPTAAAVPTTTDGATLYAWLQHRACPSCAFTRLSRAQKHAVKEYETPHYYVQRGPRRDAPVTTATTTGEQCQTTGYYEQARNVLGMTVWTYWLYVDRCWDGPFTWVNYRRYVTDVMLFWSMTNQPIQLVGGVGAYRLSIWSSAEFRACVFQKFGCFQYSYPWISFDSPSGSSDLSTYYMTGGHS
jgi:hypothetical protein